MYRVDTYKISRYFTQYKTLPKLNLKFHKSIIYRFVNVEVQVGDIQKFLKNKKSSIYYLLGKRSFLFFFRMINFNKKLFFKNKVKSGISANRFDRFNFNTSESLVYSVENHSKCYSKTISDTFSNDCVFFFENKKIIYLLMLQP